MAGEYGVTGYGYRQAVLTVYSSPTDLGLTGITEIFFKQPFNRLGYAMNFSFQRTYICPNPFNSCNVQIQNPSMDLINTITQYDLKNYKGRPRIEIRAGYSKERIERKSEANKLKATLPLIYSGYPYEFYDNKILGGRTLNFSLFDGQTVNLYGKAARFFGTFAAGSRLGDIVNAMAKYGNFQIDTEGDPVSGLLFSTRTKSKLFYNGRFILQDILPALGRDYGFTMSVNAQGVYVCRTVLASAKPGLPVIISAETGMIEQPSRVNATHWQVKTLFGLPRVLFPGDYATIKGGFLEHYFGKNNNTVSGLVIDCDYSFADTTGECTYTVAPEGEPYVSMPFLQQ